MRGLRGLVAVALAGLSASVLVGAGSASAAAPSASMIVPSLVSVASVAAAPSVTAQSLDGRYKLVWTTAAADRATFFQVSDRRYLTTTRTWSAWRSWTYASTKTSTVVLGPNGERHQARVRTKNASGWGPWRTVEVRIGLPSAVPSLSTMPGDRRVLVSWKAASGQGSAIQSYRLQRRGLSAGVWSAWSETAYGASARSAQIGGLVNGRTYQFRILATNKWGRGPLSAARSAVPRDTTAPPPVSQLDGGAVDGTTVAISWLNPAVLDLAAISVAYAVGPTAPATPGSGTAAPLASPLAESATISGLVAGQQYSISVFATDASGNVSPSATLTLRTPSAAVRSWLTTADGTQVLARQADVPISQGPGPGRVINVFADEARQTYRGTGAALTESSASLITGMAADKRAALMARLFGSGEQAIGLDYLRVPAGASDFALSSYTYDDVPFGATDPGLAAFSTSRDADDVLPRLLEAKALNPGLQLMGTPWSAPAWMKSGGSLNGGTLLPQWRQAYADYLVRYQSAYAAAGAPLDAITVVNEPLNQTSSYPSMGMSAAEQATFIRDYLGPAMSSASLSTDVFVYDHNWDNVAYPQQVLSDPGAAVVADGTAFHCYAGDVSAQSEMHASHPSAAIVMSECSGGAWETDFGRNLRWNMRNLVVGNFRNWGEALLVWNLALDPQSGPRNGGCADCRGVVTIDPATGAVQDNVEYAVLGHVAKFVEPGAQRIESTAFGPGGVENVAFRNPDGGLVLIVYSETAAQFAVAWGDDVIPYELPAGAAATLVLPTNADSGPVITPRTAGVLQDFDQAGAGFAVYQADVTSSLDARTGSRSLAALGTNGNWHTVGMYPAAGPADVSGGSRICLWVKDQTGKAGNTVALKLVDVQGHRQEIWSDNPVAGGNPVTSASQWVQFCWSTTAFAVDLTRIEHLELTWYWPGTVLVDDLEVVQ